MAVNNSLLKQEKNKKTVFDLIQSSKEQFAMALPKHVSTDRFTRVALTAVRQNPKLQECSVPSLLGVFMTLAQLGLEPGVLGQAYILPFNNKKLNTVEAQLQISYKGMIELLRRTGQLRDIYAYTVYENDEFEITYGLERTLIHKPNFKQGRGKIIGFYSAAILKDDTKAFEYMTLDEVVEHEKKYRLGQYKNSIWDKNLEEMAHKTVTKKMLKWLPISVEAIENLRNDEKSFDYQENTGKTEIKEVEKEDFELLPEYSQETGEIKEKTINNEPPKEEEEYNPFPNN